MDFQPLQATVLCEKLTDDKVKTEENGFAYEKQCIPTYKIVKLGDKLSSKILKVGDVIVTDSIPTKVSDGKTAYYIISEKYICGQIQ